MEVSMEKEKKEKEDIKQKETNSKLDELVKALKEKNEIIDKKENEIENLKIEIIKLKEQFRKEQQTIERQAEQKISQFKKSLIKEFLEIFDNFERALSAMNEEDSTGTKTGIQLIHTQISKFLKEQGVKEIDLSGKQFDPSICEIGEIVQTDKEKPNTILKVLRKGYYLGDEILRPAVVSVAVQKQESKNTKESKGGDNNE
jgi:molecular chaperone GrpE